tara:strand:+ start:1201 stop:2745 length:1545 start_codon:yes stop_codon:yes gene_type:complete
MAISNLGNGNGYIYITDTDGNILSNIENSSSGKKSVLKDALINSALASNTTSLTQDKKYYLNVAGSEGSITGATEITSYITNVGGNNRMSVSSLTTISNTLTYTRTASIQKIHLDTEASQTTSDCIHIQETNSIISDGDILIVCGVDTTRVTTLWDADSDGAYSKNLNVTPTGVGRLYLDSNKEFGTHDYNTNIMLMYSSTNTAWYEINRMPVNTDVLLENIVTVEKLKAAGVNIKKEGVNRITTVSGGGSFSPTADTTEGVIEISGTHSIGSGNYTVNIPTGGSPREGDEYVVRWAADVTTSGTVTVFGKTLVSDDYSAGSTKPFEIKTRYINSAWTTVNPITKDAAAMERDLGNPSTDGMVLTSTAAGVRSWARSSGIQYKKFTYDFAINGGAVSTIALGTGTDELLPAKAIIDAESSYIQVETALTSSGSPTVEVGLDVGSTSGGYLADDTNFFTGATAFGATPFNAVGDVVKGASNVGQILSASKVTFTINTATLTAGKVNVYVAYVEAA